MVALPPRASDHLSSFRGSMTVLSEVASACLLGTLFTILYPCGQQCTRFASLESNVNTTLQQAHNKFNNLRTAVYVAWPARSYQHLVRCSRRSFRENASHCLPCATARWSSAITIHDQSSRHTLTTSNRGSAPISMDGMMTWIRPCQPDLSTPAVAGYTDC